MKATVLYYSHKGKTAAYAREIAMYLWSRGLDVSLSSITEYDPGKLSGSDFLITGSWTCGWIIAGHHPHPRWVECSRRLSGIIPPERTLLFTTCRFWPGKLFRKMQKVMGVASGDCTGRLVSRTGFLTPADRASLDSFISSREIAGQCRKHKL